MTRQVTVDAADLEALIKPDPQGIRQAEKSLAAIRLSAALFPPQPTLKDALVEGIHKHFHDADCECEWMLLDLATSILPIVEAAVSEAADEAWNAAVSEALTIHNDSTWKFASDAIDALRRPTEGSGR